MKRIAVVRLVALLALLPAPALAQQRPGPPRAEMEERIRARFGEQVRRELGLTAAEGEALRQVEVSFQERRRELVRREGELRRQLRRRGATRTDQEARALLQEMAAVRADETRLFEAEMDALLKALTADQVLRFYQLREELMERVRRVRQGAFDGPRGGGPRGGPPGVALTTPLGLG